MPSVPDKLRLGTRASALARWQAEWVAAQLAERGLSVELVPITTQGDVKTGPLGQIGGQGLFTKELQRALIEETIDLAVHSCKDLPTEPVDGLVIAVFPERDSTADVLISNKADRIESLPTGARIGTGSLRRKAQLLHLRPDLLVEDIRGNVETRLRKLDEGHYDAIVLAEAGLTRLGLADRITCIIPGATMLPAVGQGALAIEARADDRRTQSLLVPLDHFETHQGVLAERALLFELRAGCLAPVGAWGRVEGGRLVLDAVVLSPDGKHRLVASGSAEVSNAIPLGRQVAAELLAQGAADLITAAHAS
ncbi:MAG TPA: hydroxymethylbilane synthase [Pirellulaceae bacterium]|nr:hydroxymethylbilane synthase [Pirellulaceae bacterium]